MDKVIAIILITYVIITLFWQVESYLTLEAIAPPRWISSAVRDKRQLFFSAFPYSSDGECYDGQTTITVPPTSAPVVFPGTTARPTGNRTPIRRRPNRRRRNRRRRRPIRRRQPNRRRRPVNGRRRNNRRGRVLRNRRRPANIRRG